ncbi:MAG: hypothetical protein NWF03_00810, partial [Candidatus Bathyarchaeota archaeon]|nr:hypothetical protein [Candidatus Bathyarchaeota archaeon]
MTKDSKQLSEQTRSFEFINGVELKFPQMIFINGIKHCSQPSFPHMMHFVVFIRHFLLLQLGHLPNVA